MRSFIVDAIRAIALLMLVVGVIFFIVCINKSMNAGRGFYTRDPLSEIAWNVGAIYSIGTVISSFLVFGFSFVVEAACKYLDRCEIEEQSEEN